MRVTSHYWEVDYMRLMRVDEAAERLGLKPATIRKMIFRREIPVVRPTKRAVRIREDDVEALIRLGLTPSRREGRP
jgi:excisionase family DNA binding protein